MGEIKIGLICYQKSSNAKADHFNLKSSDAIMAFIEECKRKKNIQLCVSYSVKQDKRKQIVYGSSVMGNDNDIEESVQKKN